MSDELAAVRERRKRREVRTVTPGGAVRQGLELRQAEDGSVDLVGYAALFEVTYTVRDFFGEYTETVLPGAYTKTLAERDDVRLLVNHEGVPLARTKSGTLKLSEDEVGLRVEASGLDPENPTVRELRSAMNRGDIDQMSHAFEAIRQEWNEDFTDRKLIEEKLWDVSVVTFPAAEETWAGLRATELIAGIADLDPEQLTVFARSSQGVQLREDAERASRVLRRLLESPRDTRSTIDPEVALRRLHLIDV